MLQRLEGGVAAREPRPDSRGNRTYIWANGVGPSKGNKRVSSLGNLLLGSNTGKNPEKSALSGLDALEYVLRFLHHLITRNIPFQSLNNLGFGGGKYCRLT